MAPKRFEVQVSQEGLPPVELARVTSTWYNDGFYNVETLDGEVFRFPMRMITLVTEGPAYR